MILIHARSLLPTGQPGRQVERAITDCGAGLVVIASKPVPGSIGIESPVFQRLTRMMGGVGRTSPNPSSVLGSSRFPSHGGGTEPRAGRPGGEGSAVRVDGGREGDGVASPDPARVVSCSVEELASGG